MKKIKKIFTCIYMISSLVQFSIFSADDLPYIRRLDFRRQEPSWQSFMTGEVVCEPQLTSYGFAVLSDDRTICACTDDGDIIWQRQVQGGKPNPFLTVLEGDFLLTVTGNLNLNLVNPGGFILWSVKVPFRITERPFAGRDSRIFVRGKNSFACYDIKGICKWTLETENLSELPIQDFPDGSFVAYLAELEDGKTIGLRISPFGEIMERIVFSSEVISSCSCNEGILLTFKDGGAGLCAPGKTANVDNIWALSSLDEPFSNASSKASSFITTSKEKACLLTQSGENARITFFETATGKMLNSAIIPSMNVSNIIYVHTFEDEVLIASESYAASFTEEGNVRWLATLPSMNSGLNQWNQIMYTQNGYLILCRKSWVVSSFRVVQAVGRKSHNILKRRSDYNDFLKLDISFDSLYLLDKELDSDFTSDERIAALANGMYGEKERLWATELWNAGNAYLSLFKTSISRGGQSRSVFEEDARGTNKMLAQFSAFGTNMFQTLIAKLLREEKNEAHLRILLECAGKCAYDPDNVLLDSIDAVVKKLPVRSSANLSLACDAIYEICKFMGRPAFFSHGKSILSKLLYPQYDRRVRVHAREVLKKIAELEM